MAVQNYINVNFYTIVILFDKSGKIVLDSE